MNNYEKDLISCILFEANPSMFASYQAGITPDSFTSEEYAMYFHACNEMHRDGIPIDAMTMANHIEKTRGKDVLNDISLMLDEHSTISHVDYYAEAVKDAEVRRELVRIMQEGLKSAQGQSDSTEDVLAKMQVEFMGLGGATSIPIKKVGDFMDEKIKQWEGAKNQGFVGIPSCFPKLNEYLGGWRDGCFGIMAGFKGEGKKVALFSLEDPGDVAASGIVGNHAGVSTFRMDIGKYTDTDIQKMTDAWAEIKDIPLYIVSASMDMPQVMTTATLLKARYDIDIMFMDHIQFVSPYRLKGSSRNDTVAMYSQQCVSLSKNLDIPVVGVSQLSRSAEKENREPILSDLRDSGTLEQDARQILMLFWDGEKGHHVLKVAKNNYGVSREAIALRRLDGLQRFEMIETNDWEPEESE